MGRPNAAQRDLVGRDVKGDSEISDCLLDERGGQHSFEGQGKLGPGGRSKTSGFLDSFFYKRRISSINSPEQCPLHDVGRGHGLRSVCSFRP
jgi:hypothetical protein